MVGTEAAPSLHTCQVMGVSPRVGFCSPHISSPWLGFRVVVVDVLVEVVLVLVLVVDVDVLVVDVEVLVEVDVVLVLVLVDVVPAAGAIAITGAGYFIVGGWLDTVGPFCGDILLPPTASSSVSLMSGQ